MKKRMVDKFLFLLKTIGIFPTAGVNDPYYNVHSWVSNIALRLITSTSSPFKTTTRQSN